MWVTRLLVRMADFTILPCEEVKPSSMHAALRRA